MSNPTLIRHHYRAIVLDPPWSFKGRGKQVEVGSPGDRSAAKHYNLMTLEQIKSIPLKQLAHKDGCWVFMWTTGPFLEKAFEVAKAMKLKYSSVAFYFVKLKKRHGKQIEIVSTSLADLESLFHVNKGFTTRKNIEPCLLFKFGSPKRKGRDVRELMIDVLRAHSQKPDQTLMRVERFCEGPYLEIFSRTDREGWTSWGDQKGTFNKSGPKPTKEPAAPKEKKPRGLPGQLDLVEMTEGAAS